MYILWRIYFEDYVWGEGRIKNRYVREYYKHDEYTLVTTTNNIDLAYKFNSIEEASIICNSIKPWPDHEPYCVVKLE